jgi:hypothetical protein
MPGCLLALIALFVPRITLLFIWLLTDWLGRVYETVVWPLLGFFFMPYTTLAYLAAQGHLTGWNLALYILAVFCDLAQCMASEV